MRVFEVRIISTNVFISHLLKILKSIETKQSPKEKSRKIVFCDFSFALCQRAPRATYTERKRTRMRWLSEWVAVSTVLLKISRGRGEHQGRAPSNFFQFHTVFGEKFAK